MPALKPKKRRRRYISMRRAFYVKALAAAHARGMTLSQLIEKATERL